MSFVKLSIFGTSFEVGFLPLFFHPSHPDLRSPQDMSISNPLAWVRHPFNPSSQSRLPSPRRIRASMVRRRILFSPSSHKCPLQFRKGSTHWCICCYQEDHETLQHACPLQTHLSRVETSQAHPTRKRPSPLTSSVLFLPAYTLSRQIISLSDVFISPLEDMWVSILPLALPSPHRPLLSAIS